MARSIYKRKMTNGIGINDADYATQAVISGVVCKCPYYTKWKSMFERCYSVKAHQHRPTYIGCSVDSRWHSFMSFKAWMEQQEWEGMALDKDLLFAGNKVYGPDTCVFVTHETNSFLLEGTRNVDSDLPVGVSKRTYSGRYQSAVQHISGRKHLGTFDTPQEAHKAWYDQKRQFAIELAAKQSDPRVAAALLTRFP